MRAVAGLLARSSLLVMAACSTTTTVEPLGTAHPTRTADCAIEFVERQVPARPHEAIGRIESHIKKNLFFGGKVRLRDDALQELRLKACALGGDIVVVDDYVESAAAEMTHVHVWATVLKTLH